MFCSELLAACVRPGTDYWNLAAEAHWIRRLVDADQAEAEQTDASTVHAWGMDSVPSDLGVFFLQRAAMEVRTALHADQDRVKDFKGACSGATAF